MTHKDMFKGTTYDSLDKQVNGDHYKKMKQIVLFLYHWSSKINVWSWQKLYKNRNSIGYKK